MAGVADVVTPVFDREPSRRRNSHDFEDDMACMVKAARTLADGESIEAVGIGAPGWPNEDKTAIGLGRRG